MNTFKDGEGLVHAVHYRIGPKSASVYGTHSAWQSLCGVYDDIHKGDIYLLHRRPLTCVACAAKRHDVG